MTAEVLRGRLCVLKQRRSCPLLRLPEAFAFPPRALGSRRRLCASSLCHVRNFVSEIKHFVMFLEDQLQCDALGDKLSNAFDGASCPYSDICLFRRFCIHYDALQNLNHSVNLPKLTTKSDPLLPLSPFAVIST